MRDSDAPPGSGRQVVVFYDLVRTGSPTHAHATLLRENGSDSHQGCNSAKTLIDADWGLFSERGFEPPTTCSRKRQLVYKQQLTIPISTASTSTNLLMLARACHSHSYGCPFVGAPPAGDHGCFLNPSSPRSSPSPHPLNLKSAKTKKPVNVPGFSRLVN